MTDLLSRPLLRVPTPEPGKPRVSVLYAVLTAAAVALGGLLICLALASAGWFAADTGSYPQSLHVGALGWLVANGSGLQGDGFDLGLVPLGLWLLPVLALYRAGRWVARTSDVSTPRRAAQVVAVMTATYAVICGLVSLLARIDGVQTPLPRTLAAAVVTAALPATAGVLRGGGHLRPLAARCPVLLRASVRGGTAGALVLVLAGAVLFTGSIVVHLSVALRLAEGLDAGVVGGLILAVACVGLVPNAVLWAGSFAAGPGFSVGSGTHVSPSGTRVGVMPDVPLLAAVPHATGAWWMTGLIAVPVLAGAVAGLVSLRRFPVFGVDTAALRGALAGLVGGVGFGLLTAASAGAAGPGRLAHVGPAVVATTAVCAIACTLGGAVAAAAGRMVGAWLEARHGTGDPVPVGSAPVPGMPRTR